MAGETNLERLLQGMKPELREGEYVFCTTALPLKDVFARYGTLKPVCIFQEKEGSTLILPSEDAAITDLTAVYPCRWITLNVNSSLEAVGFMAVIAGKLAAEGISVNPVSAYYHDHLFVPADRAEDTMRLLNRFMAPA